VVAGIRTPQQLRSKVHAVGLFFRNQRRRKSFKYPSLEEAMPEMYRQLTKHSKNWRITTATAGPRIYHSEGNSGFTDP
jgi:hypothetical protein